MKNSNSFETAVEIYDNKVSFLTLEKDKIIGLIVEDKNISKMQKQIFETMWLNGEEVK